MIAVLLATYNGAAWLPQFLDSLRQQTCRDWRLLARDDGSNDETLNILQGASAVDSRIAVLVDQSGRQGPTGNFGLLMRQAAESDASYFAFADQDDVWLSDKLDRQLRTMRKLEAECSPVTPLLVHTDMLVVDQFLRELHPSLMRHERVNGHCPPHAALRMLLGRNPAAGCTTLFNRPLLAVATPLPPEAVLHDWWLALCAAALGRIRYLPVATGLYRQHEGNVVGAGREGLSFHRWLRLRANLFGGASQARALHERMRQRGLTVDDGPGLRLRRYAELFDPTCPGWRRFIGVCRLGVGRPGLANRLLLAAAAAARPSSLPPRIAGNGNRPDAVRDDA